MGWQKEAGSLLWVWRLLKKAPSEPSEGRQSASTLALRRSEVGLDPKQSLEDLALLLFLLLGAFLCILQLSGYCYSPAKRFSPIFHMVVRLCIRRRKFLIMWVLMEMSMTFGLSFAGSPDPLLWLCGPIPRMGSWELGQKRSAQTPTRCPHRYRTWVKGFQCS